MSNYLTEQKAFENAISRGMLSSRSSELKALIEAIAEYLRIQTNIGIIKVKDKWDAWKERDAKEFANRGMTLAKDFEQELKSAGGRLGVEFDDEDDEDWEAPGIPKARTVVINLHKKKKKAAKYTVGQMGNAYSAAQKGMAIASGAGTKAALIGGATVASATGIGGIVVGGVATIASSGFAINSYRKTGSHLKNLVDLWNHREAPDLKRCGYVNVVANPLFDGDPDEARQLPVIGDDPGHEMVANHVLPYIIKQKSRKMSRKKFTAVPVVGLAEGGRAIVNNLAKRWKGSRGQTRLEHARWLANHFCECECELSRQIVAELYSVDEMYWLLDQEVDEVTNLLAEKMQST